MSSWKHQISVLITLNISGYLVRFCSIRKIQILKYLRNLVLTFLPSFLRNEKCKHFSLNTYVLHNFVYLNLISAIYVHFRTPLIFNPIILLMLKDTKFTIYCIEVNFSINTFPFRFCLYIFFFYMYTFIY